MLLQQTNWYKFYGKETYLKAIEIFGVKKVNRQKAINFCNGYIENSICQDIELKHLINGYWGDRSNYRKGKIVKYCKDCLDDINRRKQL